MPSPTKHITAGELSSAIGVAYGTARAILDATGTGERVGSVWIYDRTAAEAAVAQKHVKVLTFLGVTPVRFDGTDAWGFEVSA